MALLCLQAAAALPWAAESLPGGCAAAGRRRAGAPGVVTLARACGLVFYSFEHSCSHCGCCAGAECGDACSCSVPGLLSHCCCPAGALVTYCVQRCHAALPGKKSILCDGQGYNGLTDMQQAREALQQHDYVTGTLAGNVLAAHSMLDALPMQSYAITGLTRL